MKHFKLELSQAWEPSDNSWSGEVPRERSADIIFLMEI